MAEVPVILPAIPPTLPAVDPVELKEPVTQQFKIEEFELAAIPTIPPTEALLRAEIISASTIPVFFIVTPVTICPNNPTTA